ncbi:MAG: iron(III) transport system ATP-binding protein [Myxococcota bacterium]
MSRNNPTAPTVPAIPVAVEPVLQLRGLTRRFGDVAALDGLDLDVARGELLAILGPSGCGKTTALRLVAGLDMPDAGTITLDGEVVADGRRSVPPEQRRIGMVFQDYALFGHLSVAENVGYGIARRAPGRAVQVADALALVGLTEQADRRPSQLSGGQQQRVALARALAPQPGVVLLDEPFSNLDAALRDQVRREVRDILQRANATALFVTHDQEEALSTADRVAVIRAGTLHQVATPSELYAAPATRFVAEFVGHADVVDGVRAGRYLVDTPVGRLTSATALGTTALAVVIRPEQLTVSAMGQTTGTVADVTYFGHDQLISVTLDSGPVLRVRAMPDVTVRRADRVRVAVTGPVVTFPADA